MNNTRSEHFAFPHLNPLLRMVVLFFAVFFILHFTYQSASGTVVEKIIIDTATVRPSAFFINLLNANEHVFAHGHRLISPYVRLSVLNGCEGTESLFLIMAAIMAFKAPWRHKLVGLVWGILIIYLANQARIVALYFALRHDRGLFSALHGYIAPILIIAIGCLFYLLWIQWSLQKTQA